MQITTELQLCKKILLFVKCNWKNTILFITLCGHSCHFKSLITKTVVKNLLTDSEEKKKVLITGHRQFKTFVQLKVELGHGFFSGWLE